MIQDKQVAKYISEVLLKCGADINESILYVQKKCSDEEFKAYRESMSKVMADILFEGLNPIFGQYPELKPMGFK